MSDLENSQNNILREIDDTDQYDGNDMGQDFSLSRNSQSQQNLQGLNNFYNSNIYNKLKIEDYYTPYNTLQGYIEEFNKQISGLLKKSEDDFLHAYKEQMTKIQKELKTLKRKIDEETKKQKTNDKMNILEQERDYFRAEALRLDKICKDQLRDLEELKFKIQILTEDKDYYENFVIETKKENKALKSELLFLYKNKIKNHQKEQDLEDNINKEENNNNTKESNKFVSADFEFAANKSSSKTEQKPGTTQQETKPFYMTQPEFKPSNLSNRAVSQQQFSRARKIEVGGVQIQDDQKIEKRFLETTKNLRQYLERERNINQKLKAEITANNIQRTQLEEILLDCINEAKKDIQKRRLLQKATTAETRPQTQSTVPGKRLQMSWKQDFKDAMSIYHNQFKGFKYSFSTRNLGRDSVQKKDLQSPYYQFSNQTKDKIKKIQAIKINKNG
ncbi:hypothetical protein PPERSA_12210 [Pseudocohnilembus persalinus]|uniref:Uncharacterized protein n=1 Tax=Pseudocohnilembus persalinus TaxID=266149 RepID=A0A0V0R8N8_PSEPJ|nr:hypothetical protein PPERSA_12210 [Pseudocohnilembus persalinus]|eukprot:KRX10859.1 hypothetical protein PPERSA_12210 [Pseudocohnilembus persalinus]